MSERGRLLFGSGCAALVAAMLAVSVVGPAEFSVDPLGSGAVLGLLPPVSQEIHARSETAPAADEVSFTLDPFQSLEYKYELEAGGTLIYHWQASAEVLFEFHGEPEGALEEASERYQLGRGQSASGRFVAPETGVHGWYWQNRGFEPVVVRLFAAGFMNGARLYDRSGVREVALDSAVREGN